MAFTQSDLDTLNSAIASGAKSVRMNNRTYEYQSINQMLLAKSRIEQELADQSATRPPKMLRMRWKSGH